MSTLTHRYIVIDVSQQTLTLYETLNANNKSTTNKGLATSIKLKSIGDKAATKLKTYSVSTAKNGVGSQEGSECTPLGSHIIASKFGDNVPINTVFVGRVATGETYSHKLGMTNPQRDWILSRILWLAGCEEGINKGNNANGVCDSYKRYIYIHGTPDTEPMGVPLSHGCIRMRNEDIIELYELIEVGTKVDIVG